MMRLSPSRSQRSSRWKVKHVLQVCVLVAVCVWLAYQVKHSQDKKKALEERDLKVSDRVEGGGGANILKLGRKDPHGNVVIIDTDNSTQGDEEENKEAEDAAEHENKQEENEEERRENGVNETEENNKQRTDEEVKHGEESGDGESNEGWLDNAGLSDTQDHEGADGGSQEAREEHYKADDASSAVARDIQEIDQENEIVHTENSEELKEKTVVEEIGNGGNTNVTEDSSKDSEEVHDNPVDGESQQYNDASFVQTKESEGDFLSNSTVALESTGHIEVYSDTTSISEDQMEQQNSLTISEPNDQVEQQNSLSEAAHQMQVETQSVSGGADAESLDSTPENATVVDIASAEDQSKVQEIRTLEEDNSNLENNLTTFEHNGQIEQQSNSTETVSDERVETQAVSEEATGETVESTPENVTVDKSSAQDQNTVSETTTLIENNSNTENIPLERTNKSDPAGADGSHESQQTSSSTDEKGDAVQGEASSSSNVVIIAEEEKDSRTDLSTFPEVETKSAEGIVAE